VRIRRTGACGVSILILVITNKRDVSADFVVREMQRRGMSYRRINTEDLATDACTCELPPFLWEVGSQSKGRLRLADVKVVWYRRPGNPFEECPPASRPAAAVQRFVTEQWATWLEALELSPDCRWVNPMESSARFENKIRQLRLAHGLGFAIPRTLVSNDPARIRAFVGGGKAVAKALFAPLLEGELEDRFVFAETIGLGDLGTDDELQATPVIFQEAIVPKQDYRVTVVGDHIFAVRIGLPAGALDWRVHQQDVTFTRVDLPAEVEQRCFQFVRQAGLVFGAIDLLERDGTWYFLEINPSGEWGWLQQPVGLPIAEALCDTFSALNPA
jgi:glutathione synthase/RimK-type ligase-like ATP-grasp enzyme